MDRMKQIWNGIVTFAAITGVLLTAPLTYAFVNTMTRADTVTVALELPQRRKGVVTMWDAIDNDVGLGDSPEWYTDWETEQTPWADIPNAHYNLRTYSTEEHACLANNIYWEARNETLRGQIAVALVTLERVQDPRYPSDVCSVVYDDKQFSWYWDGLSDRPTNHRKFHEIALIASAVLDSDTTLYDYTYGSTHYHADYVEPYWAEHMIRLAKVDTHIFYLEPKKPATTVASL